MLTYFREFFHKKDYGTYSKIVIYLLPSATVVAERLSFHRCLSTGRGLHPPGQTPPVGRYPPGQAHMPPPGQTPPRPHTPTPGRRPLQRTVRILLECILVSGHALAWINSQPSWKLVDVRWGVRE